MLEGAKSVVQAGRRWCVGSRILGGSELTTRVCSPRGCSLIGHTLSYDGAWNVA